MSSVQKDTTNRQFAELEFFSESFNAAHVIPSSLVRPSRGGYDMPASPTQVEIANGVRVDYHIHPKPISIQMGASSSQSSVLSPPQSLPTPDLASPSPTIRPSQPKWMRDFGALPVNGVKHRLSDYDDESPSGAIYGDVSLEPVAKRPRLHVAYPTRRLATPRSLVQSKVVEIERLSPQSLEDSPSPAPAPVPLRVPVTCHTRPPSPPESPIQSLPPGPAAHSYWFEDGDLVLGVENVFLRVHGERLSRCSKAFATLVAEIKSFKKRCLRVNSKNTTTEIDPGGDDYMNTHYESVDGCPFVRLDDKVKDWLVVLEAIYDPV